MHEEEIKLPLHSLKCYLEEEHIPSWDNIQGKVNLLLLFLIKHILICMLCVWYFNTLDLQL